MIQIAKTFTGDIGTYNSVLSDLPMEHYLELLTSCGFCGSHFNARHFEYEGLS